MHHAPWRLRHIRPLPYAAFALSAAGVAVVSVQEAVYFILPLALVHAILLGGDFGFHRARDVSGEADAGALIGMSSLTALWLVLFVLRRRGGTKGIRPSRFY